MIGHVDLPRLVLCYRPCAAVFASLKLRSSRPSRHGPSSGPGPEREARRGEERRGEERTGEERRGQERGPERGEERRGDESSIIGTLN
jgi:hypothetical protein